jgi:hypothetical protein
MAVRSSLTRAVTLARRSGLYAGAIRRAIARQAPRRFLALVARSFESLKSGADSTGGCNTLDAIEAEGVLQMKQRPRICVFHCEATVQGRFTRRILGRHPLLTVTVAERAISLYKVFE